LKTGSGKINEKSEYGSLGFTLAFFGLFSYCLTMKSERIFIIIFLLCLYPVTSPAVEVAPRITDREIIESLADIRGDLQELRTGQEALAGKMDQRFENMQQVMGQRLESMQLLMNQRFESVDQDLTTLINDLRPWRSVLTFFKI
jgi:hypothetical protein